MYDKKSGSLQQQASIDVYHDSFRKRKMSHDINNIPMTKKDVEERKRKCKFQVSGCGWYAKPKKKKN